MSIIKSLNGDTRSGKRGGFFVISANLFAVLCVLSILALSVIILFENRWATGIFAVLMGAVIIIAGHFIAPVIDHMSEKKFRIVFMCVLIIFFVFLFYVANSMKYALPIDAQIVYDSVADVLDDGVINSTGVGITRLMKDDFNGFYEAGVRTNADYFTRFSINIALLLLLVLVYYFGGLIGIQAGTVEGQTLGIGFNALCVLMAVLFTCLIIRKLFMRNSYMFFALVLFVAFLPLYYTAPNFYNDMMVLAPMMCGVWLFLLCLDHIKWYWALAAGVVLGFSTHLKMTAGIIVIALILYSIFSRKNTWKNVAKILILFLGAYIAFMLLFVVWYKNCGWFDFSRADELRMPLSLWLSVGAHGDGAYNVEDVLYAVGIPGYQNRSQALWKRLREIYSSYTVGGLLEFWHFKLIRTWNDGLFDGGGYAHWPLVVNWTMAFSQPDRKGNLFAIWFSQIYMVMLYLVGLASSTIALIRKNADASFLFNISIFGTILFLLLAEAAPRRALVAIPFFICCCIYVFDAAQSFIKKKITVDRRTHEKR